MTAHTHQVSGSLHTQGCSSLGPSETHQNAADAAKPLVQKPMPPEFSGFVTVSREVFHATVGQLDVIPRPIGPWHETWGYVDEWKLRDHTLIAMSWGGTTSSETRYSVTQAFYDKHIAREVSRA